MPPTYTWVKPDTAETQLLDLSTGYHVRRANGLNLPGKDHLSARGPRQHGATYVDTFYQPRECSLEIVVIGTGESDYEDKQRELARLFNPIDAGILRILTVGTVQYELSCRPATAAEVVRHGPYGADVLIQLVADDPFFYTAAETTPFNSVIDPGLLIPFTIPAVIATSTNQASFNIANGGHMAAFPVITISGPCTNPSIINDSTGETLTISETVAAGNTLTIDMGARTATITSGGGAETNVLGSVSGTWWDLELGTNAIRITSDELPLFAGTFVFSAKYLAVI